MLLSQTMNILRSLMVISASALIPSCSQPFYGAYVAMQADDGAFVQKLAEYAAKSGFEGRVVNDQDLVFGARQKSGKIGVGVLRKDGRYEVAIGRSLGIGGKLSDSEIVAIEKIVHFCESSRLFMRVSARSGYNEQQAEQIAASAR
jgi:hypothetical protein